MLNVTLASPHRHRSLTLFPLLARDAPELPYALMADALQHGVLRITEVGSGTVPELLAANGGESTILVLDGEQLVGARQNRTTSRSLLLPAKSETKIPVSCMERGRWHFESEDFQPTRSNSPTAVRRQAREVEAERAREGEAVPTGALSAAQGRVWDTIAGHSELLHSHSDTGALDDLYAIRAEELDGWASRYAVQEGQVGLLAFLGGRPLGMDVIGCTRLYARLHERLVRGYVMDALGARARGRTISPETAQRYLGRVRSARRVESPTVGLGRYAVLAGEVIGGELMDGGRLVHLSAFPADPRRSRGVAESRSDAPIAPPSRRRRS
ncbi:MAG TPA: DUF6569 family protein [Longimicrobiaceae bacterium]|nr:DUF6569 family protein [Longimicrobiaceae bacterium]